VGAGDPFGRGGDGEVGAVLEQTGREDGSAAVEREADAMFGAVAWLTVRLDAPRPRDP
jgi:hypothetical protein